jgi:hypothetical protein
MIVSALSLSASALMKEDGKVLCKIRGGESDNSDVGAVNPTSKPNV